MQNTANQRSSASGDIYDLRAAQSFVAQAPGGGEEDLDLSGLITAIWRGKWIILLCMTLMGALGMHWAYNVSVPKFQATARLALEDRQQNVVDLVGVVSGASTETRAINTEREVIRSRELVTQAATQLNLTEDAEFNPYLQEESRYSVTALLVRLGLIAAPPDTAPDPEVELRRTVSAVRKVIDVAAVKDSYIYEIRTKTEHPTKSAEIANLLAEIYINNQMQIKFDATDHAVTFLTKRVTELEQELEGKESEIKALLAETNLSTPQALDALNLRVLELKDRIDMAARVRAQAQSRTALIDELKLAGPNSARMAELNDPILIRLTRQINGGDSGAEAAFFARLETLATNEATAIARADAQSSTLQASYDQALAEFESKSAASIRLAQMQRETEATRVLFQTFLSRLKETSIQIGLQRPDSRVLSAATRGSMVEPRRLRIIMLTVVIGMMIGMGLVLARQFIYRGFRTAEEVEKATGYTIMGQVPAMPSRARGALIEYIRSNPTSAAVEAVRNLRTSVVMSNVDQPPQVIMVTSSIPGEGKTTLSISMASNFAGLNKKVLLIEADIRRRTLSEYFKATGSKGIVSVISGESTFEDVVIHSEEAGIDVLLGEKAQINAADLLSSERFASFIAELRERYDVILIDTPPVLVVPDARVIGTHVDSILYSVRWNSTHKDQVVGGLRELSSVGLKVTGLVLSLVDPKGMQRYGYGGRYGAYSYYGRGYYDAS